MKKKKLLEEVSRIKSLMKKVIGENYDEYGDEIDYSNGKENIKINDPRDDYSYDEDDDYDYDDEDDDDDDDYDYEKEQYDRRHRIVNQIKDILPINLKISGLRDVGADSFVTSFIIFDIVDNFSYGEFDNGPTMDDDDDDDDGSISDRLKKLIQDNLDPSDFSKLNFEKNGIDGRGIYRHLTISYPT